MAKHFTLAAAQALLPGIEPLLRRGLALRSSCAEAQSEIDSIARRIAVLGGAHVDRGHLAFIHSRREATGARLKETIAEIQALGCLVKDLDTGLIDFPSLYRGRAVYLCWRLGEESIGFWHDVDDGFEGRKAVDQDFLDNHAGDALH